MTLKSTTLSFYSFALFVFTTALSMPQTPRTEKHWDWQTIDTQTHTSIIFPDNFHFGAAIAEYQNSGHNPGCNWTRWEERGNIIEQQRSGCSSDHWNSYAQDLDNLQTIGLNALRFSVEWSRIQPTGPGTWDHDALNNYVQRAQRMQQRGITPMVTLHHFTLPIWFENMGGFEYEENIAYFVTFAQKVFEALSPYVRFWCTINEPGVFCFQSYLRGVFPPGKTDVVLAGYVLKHLVMAHSAVYQALKAMPHGREAQIGIVHQHLIFEPFHPGNKLEACITSGLSHVMTTAFLNYLLTGHLRFVAIPLMNLIGPGIPLPSFDRFWGLGWTTIAHDNPNVHNELDFVGLNYYSHVLFDWSNPGAPAYRPDDIRTDMPYALYAEGLYKAIADMSAIGKPIYITECGVSDRDDKIRGIFFDRYLYALACAIQDGYDVRGYYHWTLNDNFEWDMGYTQRFGLYAMPSDVNNPSTRPALVLRDSVQKLTNFITAHQTPMVYST